MGGEHAPAAPAMAGVTFNLPRRDLGNFFEYSDNEKCGRILKTVFIKNNWRAR